MTDTELIEEMFRHGWSVFKREKGWLVFDHTLPIGDYAPTPRRALEDTILGLEADVTMPLLSQEQKCPTP